MNDILVIKLGGILLTSNYVVNNFFKILSQYKKLDQHILLVHGGDSWAKSLFYNFTDCIQDNRLCKLDYKNNTNNDFKIGLFAGTINLNLVKYAGMHGFNAIGLHYTDGDTLVFNSEHIQDFLFFKNNSLKLIHYLFKSNMIPIISSTGITKNHILINIDSDVIAALLAQELQVCLIMLTDVGGVLNGEGHIIKTMNYNMYHQLMLDGIINEGMMIKVNAEL